MNSVRNGMLQVRNYSRLRTSVSGYGQQPALEAETGNVGNEVTTGNQFNSTRHHAWFSSQPSSAVLAECEGHCQNR
jgi:hypothetical protein